MLISTLLLASVLLTPFDHATNSSYAVNSKTKEIILNDHSDSPQVPASCMKIVTTAAALQLLGPEMRFQTDLEYDGAIDRKGTLHGNLYIHGGGDPCLGSNKIPSVLNWEDQIQLWVSAVQKLGIKKIAGKVIGDATLWESALAVPSWNFEDLGNYYGAGASALSFHENYYTLTFKPGAALGSATGILRQDPPLPMIILFNEVTTGPLNSGDCACIYGSEFSLTQRIRGTIPIGVETFSIKGAIPDPAMSCSYLLSQALASSKIKVDQKDLIQSKERIVIHTTYSPPLKEIVYWTNQKSINLYAEHLLKKIGETVLNEGSTTAGVKAVTAFWHSQGIDLHGFNMADGSGLSRKNGITAKQLVAILLKMKESPHFPLFLNSLPETLPHCKAKSGSMSLIRGYAGFIDEIAFAILVNQSTDVDIKDKIKKILLELGEK